MMEEGCNDVTKETSSKEVGYSLAARGCNCSYSLPHSIILFLLAWSSFMINFLSGIVVSSTTTNNPISNKTKVSSF